jgi:hypothetical protein
MIAVALATVMSVQPTFGADAATQPALPAGHPALPAGHPQVPNQNDAAAQLPAGHPDISKQQQASKSITGTVIIRAIQTTAGGPKVGADDFTIEFYSQGQLLDKLDAKLDDNGMASVGGIPLPLNPQPLVKVTHAGVEYQAEGKLMGAQTPELEIQVPVYESTDKAPQWEVSMQHLIVERLPGAVQVTEVIAANNPGDRAWAGKPTFDLVLPARAEQVKLLGGFHDSTTKIADGKLATTQALVPGASQYQLSYVIPAPDGKAEVTIVSPAPVKQLMALVPDDGTKVQLTGLAAGGVADMGKGKSRYFTASNVPAGKELKISISGISSEPAKQSSSLDTNSKFAAQVVAGVGSVVLVLFGVAFMFIKAARK